MTIPSVPDLDVKLIDIEIWAAANRERFVEMIKIAVELLTGKSIDVLAKEKSDEKKEEVWSLVGDYDPIEASL